MTTAVAPAAPASAAPPAEPTPTPTPAAPVVPDPAQAAADAAAAAAAAQPPTPAPAAPPAPPADVQYTLALPKDAVIEASAVERATAFAKAHNLSPEAAQKALDHVNAEVAADRAAQQAAGLESFKTLARETWPAELKADKDFGGEKYLTTVEDVKRAADRFLTAEEREALNRTGWGNHPMLCRMFARIGQAIKNDKLVIGGGEGGGEKPSAAQLLYGSTKAS